MCVLCNIVCSYCWLKLLILQKNYILAFSCKDHSVSRKNFQIKKKPGLQYVLQTHLRKPRYVGIQEEEDGDYYY